MSFTGRKPDPSSNTLRSQNLNHPKVSEEWATMMVKEIEASMKEEVEEARRARDDECDAVLDDATRERIRRNFDATVMASFRKRAQEIYKARLNEEVSRMAEDRRRRDGTQPPILLHGYTHGPVNSAPRAPPRPSPIVTYVDEESVSDGEEEDGDGDGESVSEGDEEDEDGKEEWSDHYVARPLHITVRPGIAGIGTQPRAIPPPRRDTRGSFPAISSRFVGYHRSPGPTSIGLPPSNPSQGGSWTDRRYKASSPVDIPRTQTRPSASVPVHAQASTSYRGNTVRLAPSPNLGYAFLQPSSPRTRTTPMTETHGHSIHDSPRAHANPDLKDSSGPQPNFAAPVLGYHGASGNSPASFGSDASGWKVVGPPTLPRTGVQHDEAAFSSDDDVVRVVHPNDQYMSSLETRESALLKREDEVRKKKENAEKREEQAKRREEDLAKKEATTMAEMRKRMEEVSMKDARMRQLEREVQNLVEKARKKEEEAVMVEEKAKAILAEARAMEAEVRKRAAEMQTKEVEVKKREEWARRREAEIQRKESQKTSEEARQRHGQRNRMDNGVQTDNDAPTEWNGHKPVPLASPMPPMPAPSASMQAVQTHPVAGPSRLAASEKDEMADYEVLEKYKPVIRYVQEFLGKLKARRDEELRLAGSDEDLQEEAMANYQASLEKAYERILDWREKVVGTREWTPRAHALKWLEGNMAG